MEEHNVVFGVQYFACLVRRSLSNVWTGLIVREKAIKKAGFYYSYTTAGLNGFSVDRHATQVIAVGAEKR
jgi:hypothetical protein